MRSDNRPLINPTKGKNSVNIGKSLMLVSTQNDLEHVSRLPGVNRKGGKSLYTSRVYDSGEGDKPDYSVAGPYMGAPYAVMLIETLIAWGAQRVVVTGWCGSIDPGVEIGDVILADGAFVDEGTSGHYDGRRAASPDRDIAVAPEATLTHLLNDSFERENISCKRGTIWTTDAIFRETPDKIEHYKRLGAIAVEMELSALFSVAAFRGIPIAAALTVSDDLSDGIWKPGFSSGKFKKARKRTAEIVLKTVMER